MSFPVAGRKVAASSQLPPPRQLSHPDFQAFVQFLGQSLVPLVGCMSGEAPADFPDTLLAYKLLTHEQLDDLAWFFHQISPAIPETSHYPRPMNKPWIGARAEQGVSIETKRRRFGRFIGLQGCESPTKEHGLFFEEPRPQSEPLQINLEALSPLMELDESAMANIIKGIRVDSERSVHIMEYMEYK
ncbi:hypothetical protein N7478_000335 [Penicillium angulare]|uniref:uncharacterized protein n=1 Tax=Penicillium angulare TaxID=116970 RepID=UPI002540FCBA|nr:uncharacterized protein N7478_000335 [Penicillium angulare]KAJ5291084.1 hypothetical protein N7478_000335 [Penicillium angulare]